MNTSPAVSLDKHAFYSHHAAIYGSRSWPEGTQLSLTAQLGGPDKNERGPLRTLGFASIHDADSAWALLQQPAADGHNTWMSVGGLNAEVATRGSGRGKKADVLGLPALVADLDWQSAGAVHAAGDQNPTATEVKHWVDSMPLKPTVAIHSGGGAHVWLRTNFLLDPANNAEHDDIMARWKAWWVTMAETTDRSIDKAVLADAARILRPAGTWNANQGKPVKITRANHVEYSLAELQAAFPPVLPAVSKRARPATRTLDAVGKQLLARKTGNTKLGDRFAWSVPAAAFAENVWGVRKASNSGLIFPREDGSFAPDANARVYPADESAEKITIFGQRVLDHFDIDEPHSYTSWDLLAILCFGRNYSAAAKILRETEVNGGWNDTIFDAAQRAQKSGARTANELSLTADVPPAVDVPRENIRSAIESGADLELELEGGLVVRLGRGSTHGLFIRMTNDVDGESRTYLKRITSWIAWKSSMTSHLSVGSNGEPYETTAASYSVQVLDAVGRSMTRDGFTAEDAHKPSAVLDRVDIGAILPDLQGRRAVEAMLRATGRHDGMALFQEFHRLGWMRDPDMERHVFLAPAGSVTAAGPTTEFTVGAPAGSQAGAGTNAAMAIGYPTIPQTDDGIQTAAKAIRAFYDVLPNRSEVVSAILGAVFASPLGLSRRCSVFITAGVGVGKTNVAACGQTFINGDSSAKSFTGGPIANDSVVAAGVKTDWARNTVSFWDDYAMGIDPKVNDRVNQITSDIIKLSYGQDGASGGTAAGGLRAARKADSIAIITGEAIPPGAGLVSRLVQIELEAGDVALSPMGASPYDRFMREFAEPARQLQGAYIQWLAAIVDQDGLAAFTRRNDEAKKLWGQNNSGRTSETVAVLGAGMTIFRQFAQARGFEGMLPTEDEVNAGLTRLIRGNEVAVAESNPAAVLIKSVRDAIASKGGYIDSSESAKLTNRARRRLGWVERPGYGENGERTTHFEPGLHRIGYLSEDRNLVVILNEALSTIARRSGLGGVPKGQLKLAAASLVLAGTDPGDRASRRHFPGRQRGWVVGADLLDLNNLDDEFVPDVETESATSDSRKSHPAVDSGGPAATNPQTDDATFENWDFG